MLIKNCKIVSSSGIKEGDILIEGEKIKKIGKGLKKEGEVIDAEGKFVIPGIIDSHVHARDFEEKYKEDFTSCSMAAAANGITTFLDMPNTKPGVDNERVFNERVKLAEKSSLCDFGLYFKITGNNMNEIEKLETSSAHSPVGCKAYLDSPLSDEALENAIKLCRKVAVHAEDYRIIERNKKFLHDLEDFLVHGDIRENEAEYLAIRRACEIAGGYKKSVHLCHITLPKSVEIAKSANASTEVTPHHLLLSDRDLNRLKGIAKTNPPLRSDAEVKILWEKLKEGKIDIIASDHAPHSLEEKKGNVETSPSGIPNLDVMLKLMLTLVNNGHIKIEDIARMMCENPARIFSLKNKGMIAEGKDADVVILDMKKEQITKPEEFYSKAKYSPFAGWKTVGCAKTTIIRGKIAYQEESFLVKPGYGRYVSI